MLYNVTEEPIVSNFSVNISYGSHAPTTCMKSWQIASMVTHGYDFRPSNALASSAVETAGCWWTIIDMVALEVPVYSDFQVS